MPMKKLFSSYTEKIIRTYDNGVEIVNHFHYDENGQLHRLDGPAKYNDKYEAWYYHGKEHRIDGPAIVHKNRENDYPNPNQYYLNGVLIDEQDFYEMVNCPKPVKEMTIEEISKKLGYNVKLVK